MSNTRNYRVLVVDDEADMLEMMRCILDKEFVCCSESAPAEPGKKDAPTDPQAVRFVVNSAYQGEEALAMVAAAHQTGHPYALAFMDVRMPPGWDGVQTITRLWEAAPDLQVVLCTAFSDYSFEDLTAKFGFTDNLMILKKPFERVEALQIAHALTTKWQLNQQAKSRIQDLDRRVGQRTQELEQACERLRQEMAKRAQTEERFTRTFQACPVPMMIRTLREDRFIEVNDSFLQTVGLKREEVIGRTEAELNLWADPGERGQILQALIGKRRVENQMIRLRDRNGKVHHSLSSAEYIDFNNEPCVMEIVNDITERITTEEKLHQVKKMEAVSQLATGAAHDFNNIMTIIQGHADMLLTQSPLGRQEGESLNAISSAADRAANLTRQLLAFCRKQVMQARLLSLNEVITKLTTLPHLLGEAISLEYQLVEPGPFVKADLHMIEEVISNLAINAREAMPQGGRFRVATKVVKFDQQGAPLPPEAAPGEYVCITVADTGCGMAPGVKERIFEPFFTTKEVGKGSGLGLSAVDGNVARHGGWIEVDSQVGVGTEFRIFLPTSPATPAKPAVIPARNGGQGTILVVEDEEGLLALAQQVLELDGHRVLTATSGPEALEIWDANHGSIDLLLTDMVMPGGMSGHDLAVQLLKRDPQLKVIYTSGYSRDVFGKDFPFEEGVNFLAKPYNIVAMAQLVNENIGSAREAVN